MSVRIPDAVAHQLADLMQYAGKDGIIEVCTRQTDKKFKKFFKIAVGDLAKQGQSQVLSVMQANHAELTDLIAQGNSIAKIGSVISCVGAAASIVNIGVTVAGFVIMAKKLDALDGKVDAMMADIRAIKDLQIEVNYRREFDMIQSSTKQILGDVSRGKNFAVKDLTDLLTQYWVFLRSVIRASDYLDNQYTLEIIGTMLPLFFQLIKLYYEVDFDEYGADLHIKHQDWVSFFDDEHILMYNAMLRDYLVLDCGIHNAEVSQALALNRATYKQAINELNDTIELLKACESVERYLEVQHLLNQVAADEVSASFEEYLPGQGAAIAQKAVATAV